jgi:hypothetical protein
VSEGVGGATRTFSTRGACRARRCLSERKRAGGRQLSSSCRRSPRPQQAAPSLWPRAPCDSRRSPETQRSLASALRTADRRGSLAVSLGAIGTRARHPLPRRRTSRARLYRLASVACVSSIRVWREALVAHIRGGRSVLWNKLNRRQSRARYPSISPARFGVCSLYTRERFGPGVDALPPAVSSRHCCKRQPFAGLLPHLFDVLTGGD